MLAVEPRDDIATSLVEIDDTYGFPDPATYVVGRDGTIKWAYVPNNYRKRAEPEQLIEQLGAAAGVAQ